MNVHHKELAAGRWNTFSLVEQMAHVGSEVDRAFHWRKKNNPEYAQKAFERALELLDLTLTCPAHRSRLKEIARAREVLVDFFYGDNEFGSSEDFLQAYFLDFACAARK